MAEFFAMGGYGAYVWGAYGAAALILGGVAAASIIKNIRLKRDLKK